MSAKRCDNCQFWSDTGGTDIGEPSQGICQRFPPVMCDPSTAYDADSWEFPVLHEFQWCGEWKEAANDEG